MKPFFKYSGGKRKEAPTVEKYMPKEFDKFYEPFLGAGAIWLHLQHSENVVNDNFPDVMNFFRVLKRDTEKLVGEINKLSSEYSKEISAVKKNVKLEKELGKEQNNLAKIYASENSSIKKATAILAAMKPNEEGRMCSRHSAETLSEVAETLASREQKIKDSKTLIKDMKERLNKDVNQIADKYYYHYRDNTFTDDYDQALSFYLMRQLSFSGMLRFSSEGKFNIPYGWDKSFKGIDQPIDDIKKILNNTTFMQGDWKECVKNATKDDFVFLDPPYTRVFTDYHPAGQFGPAQQIELADWFKSTKAKTMIILNRDEFTEDLYKDYIVDDYDFRYSVQYRDRMTEKDSNAKHFVAINNYTPASLSGQSSE